MSGRIHVKLDEIIPQVFNVEEQETLLQLPELIRRIQIELVQQLTKPEKP